MTRRRREVCNAGEAAYYVVGSILALALALALMLSGG